MNIGSTQVPLDINDYSKAMVKCKRLGLAAGLLYDKFGGSDDISVRQSPG
jgi:hypothetical protein